MKLKLLILLIPFSLVLSFIVYRWTDQDLSETALQLSRPLQKVFIETPNFELTTDLSQFGQNPCATENRAETSHIQFVNQWKDYQIKNSESFKKLLQVRIQNPIVHSAQSILGYQEVMKENRNWIRLFEYHICYLELSGNQLEAESLLKVFMSSVLKSFEYPQPFAQNIQSLQLLYSALIEIEKFQSLSGLEEQISQLDEQKLVQLSNQFHFHSVINSIENLKDKMKLSPQIYLPSLMIQMGRLKNQMALITLDPETGLTQASSQAGWYDVKNRELIYISLFHKSIQNQKEFLETELGELKELALDLSRKSNLLKNDNSNVSKTK